MDLTAYLKSLPKSSKKDIIPGTETKVLEEKCPLCDKNLVLKPPCCSSKDYKKECSSCGYKVIVSADSN